MTSRLISRSLVRSTAPSGGSRQRPKPRALCISISLLQVAASRPFGLEAAYALATGRDDDRERCLTSYRCKNNVTCDHLHKIFRKIQKYDNPIGLMLRGGVTCQYRQRNDQALTAERETR